MSERDDDTTRRHLAYLAELADMGMDIARIAARQVAEHPERAVELTRIVDRHTRDLLKTTALQRVLAADLAKRTAAAEVPKKAAPPKTYVVPPTSRSVH
jgi:hypothetical protein